MPAHLTTATIDPWSHLAAISQSLPAGSFGANAIFIGTMRDHNLGDAVTGLYLESYPAMAQRYLDDLIRHAQSRWRLQEALVIHRTGAIQPGEVIVLLATWSAHREAAFEASRSMLEDLKQHAPFWKRETLADGTHRWEVTH